MAALVVAALVVVALAEQVVGPRQEPAQVGLVPLLEAPRRALAPQQAVQQNSFARAKVSFPLSAARLNLELRRLQGLRRAVSRNSPARYRVFLLVRVSVLTSALQRRPAKLGPLRGCRLAALLRHKHNETGERA